MGKVRKTDRRQWSEAETNKLQELAGDYTIHDVVKRYNAWAVIEGYPRRTQSSIRQRAYRTQTSLKPRFETMTMRGLSQTIGISVQTVYGWYRKGWIKGSQKGEFREIYVTVEDFKAFAQKYPKYIRNVDPLTLKSMLGEQITEEVLSVDPHVKQWQVLDRQTGEIYPTIRAAAKATYYSRSGIKRNKDRFILMYAG